MDLKNFFNPHYLIRFDDLCPAMNWKVWEDIEKILIEFNVKPILAVVPDNRDPKLTVAPAREDFWERVRGWQSRGWTIGLHGYQHRYVTAESGLIGLNAYSEFAGLTRQEQEEKIKAGLAVFDHEEVRAEIWVAPAHSFDETTLLVLKKVGLSLISDGFYLWPHVDREGMMWIPQQIWGLRRRPFGLWTVCLHHNDWQEQDLENFRHDVQHFRNAIVSVPQVMEEFGGRRRQWWEQPLFGALASAIKLKQFSRRLLFL